MYRRRHTSDRFSITKSTLFKSVRRITLSNWPTDVKKLAIETEIRKSDFLDIIGMIDAIHIGIDKSTEDSDSYLDWKHF